MAKKAGVAKRPAKNGSGRTTSLFKRTNKGEGPQAEKRGEGGELHQTAASEQSTLTTQQGIPVADDQNTLRVGARGPALLEDFHFREKIFHFDHERIPERVVHARGYGAHGFFELTDSLADVTSADVLTAVGRKTDVFVRFSTVAAR